MAAAVQVHDAIVRDAIERHGGYVFGDGRRRVRGGVRHSRPTPPLPLSSRNAS